MGMSRATTESKPRKIIMHADPKQPNDSGSVLAAARRPKKMLRWALAVILVFAVGIGGWARRVSLLTLLRTVTLFPVALAVGSAALLYSKRNTNNDPSSRAMVPLALVVAVVAAQLPPYLAVGLASACILAFSVGTLPTATNHPTIHNNDNKNDSNTNNDKSRQVMAVVGAVLLVVAVLLTENFLIWVVSATFVPGQSSRTAPPPLQDNGQRVLLHLLSQLTKPQVVSLRRLWNTQWALVACLGASLATVEYNNNRYRGRHHQRHSYRQRTLYGVATRMAVTVALARFIRTVSFGLTVIPSPVPNCYAQRFPVPPPVEWNEWIWVGLIPRSHGGCNDLIISGHATVTSSMACVATSVAGDSLFSIALWSMVVMDYAVEIYEGFHYSVDMWLGLVLVSLLWRVLEPLEGNHRNEYVGAASAAVPAIDGDGLGSSKTNTRLDLDTTTLGSTKLSNNYRQQSPMISTRALVLMYTPPVILAYMQLILFPQWMANFLIVLYTVVSLVIYVAFVLKEKMENRKLLAMHFTQHVLLSLLFMALGVYL